MSILISKDDEQETIFQTCFNHTVYFGTTTGFSPNSPSVNFSQQKWLRTVDLYIGQYFPDILNWHQVFQPVSGPRSVWEPRLLLVLVRFTVAENVPSSVFALVYWTFTNTRELDPDVPPAAASAHSPAAGLVITVLVACLLENVTQVGQSDRLFSRRFQKKHLVVKEQRRFNYWVLAAYEMNPAHTGVKPPLKTGVVVFLIA